jgi:SAM-dependent methyltransferase
MTFHTESRRPLLGSRIGAWLKKPRADKLRSVAAKGRRTIDWAEDVLFEKWYRLDCSGYIPNSDLETVYAASRPHAVCYQAVRCVHVGLLIDEAKKTGIVFDNFIDLGSGKGKACFYAANKYRFKQLIGVEFSGPLVEAADANRKNFGAPNIRFLHMDAAQFALPEGNNLVFLFNPFGEFILRKFLENNIDQLRQSRSVIAYVNDHHRLCMTRLGFSTLFRSQNSRSSLHQLM